MITKIPIHKRHEVVLLDVENLMYVEAEEGYTIHDQRWRTVYKLQEAERV